MPIYGFRCTKNEAHTEEHYYPLRGVAEPRQCETCAGEMVRDLTVEARNHIAGSAFPYITKNITGEPIEVRSALHLRELEKMHGVRLRDDAEYIDEQLSHVDNRVEFDSSGRARMRSEPVYSGGRGGGSGCRWV